MTTANGIIWRAQEMHAFEMTAPDLQFCSELPHLLALCTATHSEHAALQGRLRLLKEYLTRKAAGGALAVAPADRRPSYSSCQ